MTRSLALAVPVLFLLAGLLRAAGGPAPGINRFAAATYRELATGPGNLILSPFSIATALSMLLDGARGRTAAELAGTLDRVYPDPAYPAALASLVEELTLAANTGGNELSIANGLWVQRGFPIQSGFQRTIETLYHAPLTPLDFIADPGQACAKINSWTAAHTQGKIPELFAPGSLTTHIRLILTSAIYFHGKWQSPFRAGDTHPAPFRLDAGATVETGFMRQSAVFGYSETPQVQILEMKYAGSPLAFDVLLPTASGGLAELEKSLQPEKLSAWLGDLQNRTVEVALPKFRAESGFSLRDALARMGMREAFEPSADFSGIDGRRDLFVSDVIHKAFVDVSEEGTEAAAATGVTVKPLAMRASPRTVFRADRPFAFLIRDTGSGLVLFEGRLLKPEP